MRSKNAMSVRKPNLSSRSGGRSPRRRRVVAERRRNQVESHGVARASRLLSLIAERLESRTLLAVTADLVGAELQINLGAADDVAYLSNDGFNYVVRGTGLSGFAAPIASADSVAVTGTAAANQSFNVAAGVAAVLWIR